MVLIYSIVIESVDQFIAYCYQEFDFIISYFKGFKCLAHLQDLSKGIIYVIYLLKNLENKGFVPPIIQFLGQAEILLRWGSYTVT